MKITKVLCLIIVSVFIITIIPSQTIMAIDSTLGQIIEKEEKIYYKADLEGDFSDDRVLVVLNKSKSNMLKDYTSDNFSEIEAKSVCELTENTKTMIKNKRLEAVKSNLQRGLTSVSDVINNSQFNQILSIELKTPGKKNVLEAIKKLEKRDEILYVGPDYTMHTEAIEPNDEKYRFTQYGQEEGQWGHWKTQVPEAWEITTGSSNVVVGVIDTGVWCSHEDLQGQMNTNLCYDFTGEIIVNDTMHLDGRNHGTGVASIIGAKTNNDRKGISGVCWNITMVSLKVFNNTDGTKSSYQIRAIDFATSQNIPILNASIGGYIEDFAVKVAISNYPGLFVCSAGNDKNDNDTVGHYPSNWDLPNLISVAATNKDDELWVYFDSYDIKEKGSNYGKTTVHLAAPGYDIWHCIPTDENGEKYKTDSGTSLAAPYVTGVAALIKSIRPDLSAKEIKALILDNVDPVDALSDKCITGGRLNAYKAVRAATESQTFTGDVNGDGKADIILSRNIEGRRAITVYLGNPNGTFTEPITTLSTWTFYYNDSAYVGDFDGDGLTDVVIQWNNYGYRQLLVYRSRGDGSFYDGINLSSSQELIANTLTHSIHIADVNGDNKDDFVVHYESESGYRNALVYKGTSSSPYLIDAATPALESGDTYNNNEPVYTGDFNGDGRADMVVHWTNDSNYRQLRIYLGTANGYFLSGGNLSSLYSYSPVSDRTKNFVADVNGDGYDDFVVQWKNASSGISVLVYKGSGSFPYMIDAIEAISSTNPYNETDTVFTGDVNGDGKSDMVICSVNSNNHRQFLIYTANSNGSYNNGTTINTHNPFTYPETMLFDDVNGDGLDDIVVKRYIANSVRWLTYRATSTGSVSTAISTVPTTAIPFYNSDSATQSRAGTYKIINVGAEKCLNVYGDNVTSLYNQQNVCLWEDSGTNEQRWYVTGIGNNKFIKSVIDTNFGLNVYRAGNPWNCDLYPTAGNETDSLVDFIETDGGFKIKLHNYDLYLTAASSANGANVYWSAASTSTYQLWSLVSA